MKKADFAGTAKPDLDILSQMRERLTFLYAERAVVNRADCAITLRDARGTVYVPAASLSVLMLGPGTSMTHRAIELLSDCGVCVIWVGEQGVRYYAHGRPLTHSSALLTKQAQMATNMRLRLGVAREMYCMRFPNEDVSNCTMQQLRGREGARIRGVYRRLSKQTGVPWDGREYDPNDYAGGSEINKALSAANACLYGLAHSAIVALGCASGLGFVHIGHERSFVYDIADLYKTETTIPVSFQVVAEKPEDVGRAVRTRLRDVFVEKQILKQMVTDIHRLICEEVQPPEVEILQLWDEKVGAVQSGVSWSDEEETVGYGIPWEEPE